MKKFKVKMWVMYTETVIVEADDENEAVIAVADGCGEIVSADRDGLVEYGDPLISVDEIEVEFECDSCGFSSLERGVFEPGVMIDTDGTNLEEDTSGDLRCPDCGSILVREYEVK